MSRITISEEAKIWHSTYKGWYICPKCKSNYVYKTFNYCPNCGVELLIISEIAD